jgi:hypothetical protein
MWRATDLNPACANAAAVPVKTLECFPVAAYQKDTLQALVHWRALPLPLLL